MKCPYCGAETMSRKCEYCNSDLSEQYMNNGTIGGAVTGAINNIGQSIANNINNIPNRNNPTNNMTNNMNIPQQPFVQNIIIGQAPQQQPVRTDISPKNRTVALILCIIGFFGVGGLHRLYTGHILSGILWLCTGGLFSVGTIIDLLLIVTNNFKDNSQLKLLPEENR